MHAMSECLIHLAQHKAFSSLACPPLSFERHYRIENIYIICSVFIDWSTHFNPSANVCALHLRNRIAPRGYRTTLVRLYGVQGRRAISNTQKVY